MRPMKEKIFSEIVLNNFRRERLILSRYACKNSRGIRKYPEREKIPDRENIRPVFFHDTDKIIHSKAYTRYIDKTQVFSLFENDHITHRVLHVQFVSKIARVIGRCLKLNEDLNEEPCGRDCRVSRLKTALFVLNLLLVSPSSNAFLYFTGNTM